MSGWHKISGALALDMIKPQPSVWSKARPCPAGVAAVELAIIAASLELHKWTIRKLAIKWGVSRRVAGDVYEVVALDALAQGFEWAGHFRATDCATDRAIAFEESRDVTEQSEPLLGHSRATLGPLLSLNARASISDLDADSDPDNTPRGDGRQGSEEKDRTDPGDLFEIWRDERTKADPKLQGRSPGLAAMWPVDLLMLSPADAETAVRAVAELCRGTESRAPRVMDWSQLFGERGKFRECWEAALAWKTVDGASEPAIGRTYIMSKGGPNGVRRGVGGGPGKAGEASQIVGRFQAYDPDDEGWDSPEEKAEAEALAERLRQQRDEERVRD